MVNINFCRWLNTNLGSLESEATALPAEPQPLPNKPHLFISLPRWETKISINLCFRVCRPKLYKTCLKCVEPSPWPPSRTSSPTRPTGSTRTPKSRSLLRRTSENTSVREEFFMGKSRPLLSPFLVFSDIKTTFKQIMWIIQHQLS